MRAPASTANLGPGFDCAAVALDLWNELEVTPGDEAPDREHLGVRAFARIAPAEGWSFRWTSRIPRERGLGSSASVIALGLVAASLLEHGRAHPTELFAHGL
ncbi:MAG: homoserine kinase, partial [Actinomycetota bacterium]